YAQPLAKADLAGFAREFFAEHHYYAPLVHLVTGFFYLVLGASRLSGIAVNLLSMALLLYSVYWIGGKLYGKPRPAGAPAPGLDPLPPLVPPTSPTPLPSRPHIPPPP